MDQQQWEYLTEVYDGYTENIKDLNNFGADGWELVNVVYIHINGKSKFYFKRKIKTPEPKNATA